MSHKKLSLLSLAVMGLLTLPYQAARAADAPADPKPLRTIIVDAEKGSDATDPGPYRTLQKAANSSKPGDLIIVRKGKYAGFIMGWDDPQSGTAQFPIVFKADPDVTIVSRDGKTPDGINIENTSYIIIDGFNIDNSGGSISRAGIRSVQNRDVIIRNNTADHCGTWGVYTSFSEHVTIENNVTSNSKSQHGIYVANSADDPVIRGNTVFGNRNCGIHLNGDASQGADGIISRALIENNIVHDNGSGGGAAINCDGVQDSRIQNNLLYNNHSTGIALFRGDASGGACRDLVVNNTILMANDARWAVNINGKSTGNTLYNNILLNQNKSHGAIMVAPDSMPGFYSDYNAVDGRFSFDGGDTIIDIAHTRSETFSEKHSVVATPNQVFVNVAKQDFRPSSTSLALEAGINRDAPFNAPATDIMGDPRTGDKRDLGAYQPPRPLPAAAAFDPKYTPTAMLPTRYFEAGAFLVFCVIAGFWMLRKQGMHRWITGYLLTTGDRAPIRENEEVHVLICIGDHFEPHNGGVSDEKAGERLRHWSEQYPLMYGDVRDSDGCNPRHTFFYPIEQYHADHVEAISSLCRAGFGEIEIHLHHDKDTPENLRKVLEKGKRLLAERHGAFARNRHTGDLAYAFIHGDWALDNSHPQGHHCGINNELDILRETGCYADLTLPAAPDPAQTRKVNSIYYAVDDPNRPNSHDAGQDVGRGERPRNSLMLIQGPLLLNWRRRKWGLLPRLENGCVQGNHPASMDRLDLWLRARVHVPQRPDWFFVKLHSHGANEDGQRALLRAPMLQFHRDLAARARTQPTFHYHYVTAREMYNLARAAESGWKGSVNAARDFELVSNLSHHVLLERKKTA